jgi:hypothetical protein
MRGDKLLVAIGVVAATPKGKTGDFLNQPELAKGSNDQPIRSLWCVIGNS